MSVAKTLQVRDLPDDAHAVLRRRAAAEGKSLSEYVRGLLVHQASSPTAAEVIERAQKRGGPYVSTEEIVAVIRADRDRRG